MKRSSNGRTIRSLPLRGAVSANVRDRLLAQPVLELLEVKAARLDVFAQRFPGAVRALEGAFFLSADEADRPVVRRRRLLGDERAFAVPRDVVRARPAMAGTHPLAI